MAVSSTSKREAVLAGALAMALLLVSTTHIAYEFIFGFGGHRVLAAAGQDFGWNTALARTLAGFFAAQIALHALFGVALYVLARLSAFAWPRTKITGSHWVGMWFVIGTLWILLTNGYMFPNSELGQVFSPIASFSPASLPITAWYTAVLLAAALGTLVSALLRARAHRLRITVAALLFAGVTLAATIHHDEDSVSSTGAVGPPHVILIGVDSLRPDFVDERDTGLAPALSRFAAKSVRFSDTITPLARTFPSWVAILTGRHPQTTGAIVNLIPEKFLHLGPTLPEILGKRGYRTVYAIDETRFSNIDTRYGFEQALIPPIGAADFVLGELNDFPLSNLILNTRVGEWLFPHTYANRGAASRYDPDTFIRRLDRELSFAQPTFFAVHLTLVHWPYTWSDSPRIGFHATDDEPYRRAVLRVDQQFEDLIHLLRRKGALDNAIVVLLSDHGEALNDPHESLIRDEVRENPIRVALAGHGTSVLVPSQYQTLLAFRRFGPVAIKPHVVTAPASLEDIAPTVLEMLEGSTTYQFDGRSLAGFLGYSEMDDAAFRDRIRLTETESNAAPIVSIDGKIDQRQIEDTAGWYRVDAASGRVYLRDERVRRMKREREYAALRNGQLLAALPTFTTPAFRYVWLDGPGNSPQEIDPLSIRSQSRDLQALWNALQSRIDASTFDRAPATSIPAQTTQLTTHVTK